MIAIIGGGITGLTAAYALRKKGIEARLLEERDRPGGVVCSEKRDGFLVEHGPHSLMAKNPHIADLIGDLSIEGEQIHAAKSARKRYIVKEGRLAALPSSPPSLLTNRIFSLRGKSRVLLEPFIRRGSRKGEGESVASFVERRLGTEVLDYAVNPFVSGIFAGDPDLLSVRHAFPKLYAMEQEHGSLLKGLIRSRRSAPKSAGKKGGVFSFRNGIATLPQALAATLSDSILLNARVTGIARENDRWAVSWNQNGQTLREVFERVLITAPAHRVSELGIAPTPSAPGADLKNLPYSPLSVLALGFERPAVEHPLDGFGFLVPQKENLPILGASFPSSIFPERAPDGCVLISTYVGGAGRPELAGLPEEE
ncbi:MAG: protoporphyrinogen oxidase, partial [Opitutales bacterium]